MPERSNDDNTAERVDDNIFVLSIKIKCIYCNTSDGKKSIIAKFHGKPANTAEKGGAAIILSGSLNFTVVMTAETTRV